MLLPICCYFPSLAVVWKRQEIVRYAVLTVVCLKISACQTVTPWRLMGTDVSVELAAFITRVPLLSP